MHLCGVVIVGCSYSSHHSSCVCCVYAYLPSPTFTICSMLCASGHPPPFVQCVFSPSYLWCVCERNYGCLPLMKEIRDIPSYFLKALDTLSLSNHVHIYNVHLYMHNMCCMYMCTLYTCTCTLYNTVCVRFSIHGSYTHVCIKVFQLCGHARVHICCAAYYVKGFG